MEGRAKVTRDILCEEARFILANVLAEGRYGRQNRYEDIKRVCEGAVSIPFSEYAGFLESAGYLRHDATTESLEVTSDGEAIVSGSNLGEFAERAVAHFKNARARRNALRKDESRPVVAIGPGPVSSGGRPVATAGGEIQSRGEMVDARYEKLSLIGSGGIGSVHRARQVPLAREVALKEIRDLFGFFSDEQAREIVRRFAEVVRDAAQLAHPNILPIHDVNLDREHPYVVSELAPNGSARRLITDAEEIPVGVAVKYLLQTLHALRAAHAQGVVHRGIKPENLLIDAYGNVKVSDFGFGRIVERDAAVIRHVYVGAGTVAYLAPELFTDPQAAGPQADIYALGIVFYELLTRKLPGRRSPMPSQVQPELPAGIDDIFDRMTRDERSERYVAVDEILADFGKLEGLGNVLDRTTQVLVAVNPLDSITFRAPPPPGEAGAEVSAEIIAEVSAEAIVEEVTEGGADRGDDGSRGTASHRPYSFQQRQKPPR